MAIPSAPSLLPLLAAALLSGCAHAPPVASAPAATAAPAEAGHPVAEVRAAIEAGNARFVAAFLAGDAAALARCFTEDGVAIPAAVEGFVKGRAALEAYYASRLGKARALEAALTPETVEVVGETAYEIGTSRLVLQVGDAPPVTRTGRFLVVWRRQPDGRWLIGVDAVIPDPPG